MNQKKSGLFVYLLFLTGFFILLEISLFIQRSDIYLGEYTLIADHIKIPGSAIPGIIYYIFVQFALHFLYTLMIWILARSIAITLNLSWHHRQKAGFILWGLGIVTLLLANQYFFPNSKFAINYLINSYITNMLFLFCSMLMGAVILLALWGLITVAPFRMLGLISVFILILLGNTWQKNAVTLDVATADKPNIIFIGIDSLRPDFVGYFGYEKITPHLDNFLNQATVFADAFSPLARTFPAWVSILSGQYPKLSGVRSNLDGSLHFNLDNTLPNILRQQGYETMFATDETRFSNIDERFGFDKVVTPPIGFNDFVLGSLNDFPMANLLVNTAIGQYLFPNSYGNRPAYVTYDPNSFINFLKPTLAKSRTKPLFFAVHFCLPHYPYFWGTRFANDKSIRNYQISVARVDQQFNDFFNLLKQYDLLNHAVVVVLSDHGEAIELPGDRVTSPELFIAGRDNLKHILPHFYPPMVETEAVDKSAGHGTDVLGLVQYHIVLAFKTFGLKPNSNLAVTDRVSLLDLKPTILDFINHPNDPLDNGVSLKKIILGQQNATLSFNHFFIESDYSPQAVHSVHPETSQLLFQGINYYQINPVTGRISVKDNMMKLIISSKQYADIYHDWILALYPQSKTTMMPILVNLTTGQWTNDLQTPFAKSSPAYTMLGALKNFYRDDITIVLNSN